jgi:hypothetical protein
MLGDRSRHALVDPEGKQPPITTLEKYRELRLVVTEAERNLRLPLLTLERALYNISGAVRTDKRRTWAEYRIALLDAAKGPASPSIDSGSSDDEKTTRP